MWGVKETAESEGAKTAILLDKLERNVVNKSGKCVWRGGFG